MDTLSRKKSCRYFSLIELLASLAIILILMGMTMSAALKAKRKASKTVNDINTRNQEKITAEVRRLD